MTIHDPSVAAASAAYAAAQDAMLTAHLRLSAAVDEFRATHPAPPGKVWREQRGEMYLDDVDTWCCYSYAGFVACSDEAVTWNDDGRGLCERHKEER